MSADGPNSHDRAARPATLDVSRSARDGLSVRVHAPEGAFYSYHLYRGTELAESTPYGRDPNHTFEPLPPGTYRCRAFVRTSAEERFVLSSDRITIAPRTSAPLLADARRADVDDLPEDSDYGTFLPAVTLWRSVADFVEASDWPVGVNVIGLESGLHLDVHLGDDLATIPHGRGLPVIFSGAVSSRRGNRGPFFSGIGLGRSIG